MSTVNRALPPVMVKIGDCREVMRSLPEECVDCVVTSPPYFGLRDYGGTTGQVGHEATPNEFVAALVDVFREVWRVLKPTGTVWLNIGDSYNGTGASRKPLGSDKFKAPDKRGNKGNKGSLIAPYKNDPDLKPKELMGIPWRVAFALQADGWYLRQEIIWSKPNPMVEPVRDRCTRAHEHVFLLTKKDRYFFNADAIAETMDLEALDKILRDADITGRANVEEGEYDEVKRAIERGGTKNKRSVWTIPLKTHKEHTAAYPPKLVEPCVLAGCPEGGTVMDPFGGSGTTAMVAKGLGRRVITMDLNPEYEHIIWARIESGK